MRNKELDERLQRYLGWFQDGKIPGSSRVIPVREALDSRQKVLAEDEAMALVEKAGVVALADCDCRTKYRNCDNPVETCIYLDKVAEKQIDNKKARRIGPEEARRVMRLADEHGLVRMTINNPDQKPFAICSCCTCCCHEMQFLLDYGRSELIVPADLIAADNEDECIQCGVCVERCRFGARIWQDDFMVYEPEKCFGCGLCVSTCPGEAVSMRPRA